MPPTFDILRIAEARKRLAEKRDPVEREAAALLLKVLLDEQLKPKTETEEKKLEEM